MPEVGEIAGALQQAAEGLRTAQSAAAQLDAGAQRVQFRAGGTGFRRVAEQVGQVRQRVNRIRQAQAALVATVAPISDTVGRVSDGMDPAEVVAALAPAAQQLSTASASSAGIVAEVDRLKSDIKAATKGGQPGPLIAMADKVKHALVQVAGSLDTAKQRTDQTISEARQLGSLPAGDGSGAGATPPSLDQDPSPDHRERDEVRFIAGTTGGWNITVNRTLLPNRTYVEERTGYRYETDAHGRVDAAEGKLVDDPGTRNPYQQAKAGGPDRLDTDHGGHLFATVFRGPGERINLVPMDSNLNQGVWKAMENRWARALERGKAVRVSLRLEYDEHGTRPRRFEVKYQIEGRPIVVRTFQNKPGGQ